jgi:hypothetical protein
MKEGVPLRPGARKADEPDQRRLGKTSQHGLRCRYQIVGDVAGLMEGNALHRIDDVAIEAREKPEAMFAREVLPLVGAGIGLGNAARFSP